MAAALKAPTQTIHAIEDDLDTLEEILEPLFSHPLDETLDGLSLINRAKLQTLIPYVVHDLIICTSASSERIFVDRN